MDKTININLGGTLFQVDEDAYQLLKNYLNAINSRFRGVQGAAETIEDIEIRIAEIFQSQRGIAGVVTKENVEAMIAIIGKPEDFEAEPEQQERSQFPPVRKRMYRSADDRIISGVCGGIGAYLNTDPVIFRVLFALFALCFGTGFLVYLVLWVALPLADSDSRRRELYGEAYNSAISREKRSTGSASVGNTSYNSAYYSRSSVSNAFNEIFGAVGRVLFIILRVFLIIIGIVLVITGSVFILSYVMVFIFKYPGAFSTDAFDVNIAYFPDFLGYIVTHPVAPWIIILASVVFLLPMLAMIYWGVKMIFWFSARDGIYSLIAFVVWVISAAALSMILFNEGISFAETGRSESSVNIEKVPPTLYLKPLKTTDSLKYEKEFSLIEEGYTVFINEDKNEMHITPFLQIGDSGNGESSVRITRRSTGRSRTDASMRADELNYSWELKGDTLFLDSYFTVPQGRKWSADNIGIYLNLPEGTKLIIDKDTETLLTFWRHSEEGRYIKGQATTGERMWIVKEDGIELHGTPGRDTR
ncbi:MAG: PspC domain-containing protein [Bacteroidales bacterium]|nr:PspC domain-containing protein [Bacteroidales bacterium]MCU0408909.1 PspC domain-containing protein [Bacteroidales bacterium]